MYVQVWFELSFILKVLSFYSLGYDAGGLPSKVENRSNTKKLTGDQRCEFF